MLEVEYDGWSSWKKNRNSKFEKSIPFALLCQVAGWSHPEFPILSCLYVLNNQANQLI